MPKKKYKTHAERSSELLTKAHGLHYRLDRLVQALRPLLDNIPSGSEKEQLVWDLVMSESALEEHDPTK